MYNFALCKILLNLKQISTSLYISLQIAAENVNKNNINVIALSGAEDRHTRLFEEMEKIAVNGIPRTKVHYQHISYDITTNENEHVYKNVDVILVQNLSRNENVRDFYKFIKIVPRCGLRSLY